MEEKSNTLVVPEIGDYSDVEIIEINVAVGDTVKEEDSLITLETDKASMEVPAPFSGTIKKLHISLGDKVSKGDIICLIGFGAGFTWASCIIEWSI